MSELLAERSGTTLILTLNRPEKVNALSAPLVEALSEQVKAAEVSGIRLLVLKGNGRNFSAGFDFMDYEAQSEGDLLLRFVRIELLLQALRHARYETMALAHGRNFGAGVDLVCCCDHRIVAPSATFRMPGLSFGLLLGTRRYAEAVGSTRAQQVLAEAVTFDADGALADGFSTAQRPIEQWPAEIASTANRIAAMPDEARAALRQATFRDTRSEDLADGELTPKHAAKVPAFGSFPQSPSASRPGMVAPGAAPSDDRFLAYRRCIWRALNQTTKSERGCPLRPARPAAARWREVAPRTPQATFQRPSPRRRALLSAIAGS